MSVLTKRFLNYASQRRIGMTLKEFIIQERKKFLPGYESLSRRKKKEKLGTIRKPSKDFVNHLYKVFTSNLTIVLE